MHRVVKGLVAIGFVLSLTGAPEAFAFGHGGGRWLPWRWGRLPRRWRFPGVAVFRGGGWRGGGWGGWLARVGGWYGGGWGWGWGGYPYWGYGWASPYLYGYPYSYGYAYSPPPQPPGGLFCVTRVHMCGLDFRPGARLALRVQRRQGPGSRFCKANKSKQTPALARLCQRTSLRFECSHKNKEISLSSRLAVGLFAHLRRI